MDTHGPPGGPGGTEQAPWAPSPAQPTRPARTALWLGLAGLVVLALVGGGGVVLLLSASSDEDDAADTDADAEPQVGITHWHAALGVYICGEGEAEAGDGAGFVDVQDEFDGRGIHSHGDEVIHIHPHSRAVAGGNARLSVYIEDSPLIDLTEDHISVGDQSWTEGEDTCNGEEAEVVVARWAEVIGGGEPDISTDGFDDLRFRGDLEGYVLAFVPKGEHGDIPPAPSAEYLAQVSGSREDMLDPDDLAPATVPDDEDEPGA